jgi:HD-like signal output (HDOD) protein
VTYGSFAPSAADKAAWIWYEIDRCQRIGAAIVTKYDLDPDLLRALEDAHQDDDSRVALDELLDIAEAAIAKRDKGDE